MSKAIQVNPKPDISQRIDKLVGDRIAKSRAGVCDMALEAILPLIEGGDAVVINGKVVFLRTPPIDSGLASVLRQTAA